MPVTVVAPANWRLDPQAGVHRQSPGSSASNAATSPFYRLPTAQDRRANYKSPYANNRVVDRHVSTPAEGFGTGPAMNPVGYSPVDYGKTPQRIPRLWYDGISMWEGANVRGSATMGLVAHSNHWLWIPHFRPAPPTRGYRSVSGVLAGQASTSSNVRIPAVFVPSSAG
jgi:hypothetical protein